MLRVTIVALAVVASLAASVLVTSVSASRPTRANPTVVWEVDTPRSGDPQTPWMPTEEHRDAVDGDKAWRPLRWSQWREGRWAREGSYVLIERASRNAVVTNGGGVDDRSGGPRFLDPDRQTKLTR